MNQDFLNHFHYFLQLIWRARDNTPFNLPWESCRIYQQEICALQERIFALETEMGLHETLPMESSGKKSTFTSKGKGEKTATYNLKLNDTVSFPRL